jgi:hypothetical protein
MSAGIGCTLVARQAVAFGVLVLLQTAILIAIKIASRDAILQGFEKPFQFSPSASLAVAEFLKLFLSALAFLNDDAVKDRGVFLGFKESFSRHVSCRLASTYGLLSFAYATGNHLLVVLSTTVDPGSISLFKSMSPLWTVVVLWVMYSRPLNQLQWISIVIMTFGIVIVQVDACKGIPLLNVKAYEYLVLTVAITTGTSVVNAETVNKSACPLPLQNMILYSVGTVANSMFHFATFEGPFFKGMHNHMAIIIIIVNTLQGLAINFVYKISTAIVKTVAQCFSMALLVYISAVLFDAPLRINTVIGSLLVILATYMYMRIALPMNDAPGNMYSTQYTQYSSTGTVSISVRSMKTKFAFIMIVLVIIFATLGMMFSTTAMLFISRNSLFNFVHGNMTTSSAQVEVVKAHLEAAPIATGTGSPNNLLEASQPAAAHFNKDDVVRANWGKRLSTNVSVAMCITGLWRSDFRISLPFITKNLIESLHADVFAVSDGDLSPINKRPDRGVAENLSITRLKELFGSRLKDAEHIPANCMRNVCPISFPEICNTQKSGLKMFPYYFKIWRCGQLIHKAVRARGADYDVVLFLRPDMLPRSPFHLQAVTSVPGVFKLSVAKSCVEFSQREIVVSTAVLACGADDLWLGSYAAMTVFMDLVRFVTTNSSFLSPEPSWDEILRKIPGGEVHVNWLAWRTGIHLLRFQTQTAFLAALLGGVPVRDRESCLLNPAGCSVFSPDNFQLLQVAGNACQRLGVEPLRINYPWDENSCHDRATGRSLEWHAGRGQISRARRACNNVTNLATHNPLGTCRRRDDNSMSWKPGAHRVFVERGFGMPFIFENSSGSLLRC